MMRQDLLVKAIKLANEKLLEYNGDELKESVFDRLVDEYYDALSKQYSCPGGNCSE